MSASPEEKLTPFGLVLGGKSTATIVAFTGVNENAEGLVSWRLTGLFEMAW